LLSPFKRFVRFSHEQTPPGSLLSFEPGNVSIRIHPVTEWLSLSPDSFTRTSNSVPCGFACPDWSGRIYGFTTFRLVTTDNLDPSRTPVEQRSRMATLESHNLSTNLFGLSLPVWLARFFLTTLQMFAYADLIIQS
jgi:hypothetical protein